MAFALLCFARQARKESMERPVARPMISSLNLHVSWKPVNPQECVWKKLYRNIMRNLSQDKGTIHYSITTWWPGRTGPPKRAINSRRRTREGPEPACVQTPLMLGWHTQEGKDELTSCRGTVLSAWQKTSGPHVSWKCAQVTGKAGENGQNSGEMGGSSSRTRPSAPECGDTLKALAGDQRPI